MIHIFEYAVIGKGLIGSACARHLSGMAKSVALIGPDEPADWKQHSGVFASHYDSGRITRVLDTDYVWALLAKRSIDRYREIEQRSGIEFFHPAGCMKIVPASEWGEQYLAANESIGKRLSVSFNHLNAAQLKQQFPYLNLSKESIAILESDTAGWIDPRKLIEAQTSLAEKGAATVVRETVVGCCDDKDGSVLLNTDSGRAVKASKTIITAGAFSNFNSLTERKLKLTVRAETTVLARISPAHLEQLAAMPSIILFLDQTPNLRYVYMVPPVVYPDGHAYLKLGGDREVDHVFHDLEGLQNWFHSDGGEQAASEFKAIIEQLFPKIEFTAWQSKPCVITDTVTERPYIGKIDDRTFVATGGCGAAAKSSDEIGRLAALSLLEQGYAEYGADPFPVVFENSAPSLPQTSRRKFHF